MSFDHTSLSMLRQLREKFSVINKEMQRWTALQNELLAKIQQVTQLIREAGNTRAILSQTAASLLAPAAAAGPATDSSPRSAEQQQQQLGLTKDERRELGKGVSLIRKQVQQKYQKVKEGVASSRKEFVDFHSIHADLTELLSLFDASVKEVQVEFQSTDNEDPAVAEITNFLHNQAGSISAQVSQCTAALTGLFDMLDQALRSSQEEQDMTRMASTSSLPQGASHYATMVMAATEEIVVENVTIEAFDPSLIYRPRTVNLPTAASNASAALIGIDSPSNWSCPLSLLLNDHSSPSAPSLLLSLPTAQVLSSLQLQGGQVAVESTSAGAAVSRSASLSSIAATPEPPTGAAALLSSVVLPCGVSLASIEPRYELTAIALADVFDWTDLIKSNQPEKFLKRPPVRFLFDLIRFVGANNAGFLDEELSTADWAVVGADKTSKLDFMEKVHKLQMLTTPKTLF